MSADPYTFVNVPSGTVTRMEISDTTARAIVAEYGGAGWRVCKMGKVIVLHTAPEGEPKPAITRSQVNRDHFAAVLSYLERNFVSQLEGNPNLGVPKSTIANWLSDVREWRGQSERMECQESKAAGQLEHAAANLLNCYQNGVPADERMWSQLSDAVQAYRKGAQS